MNAPTDIAGIFTPGCWPDLPAETYHAVEALSASGAKKLLQSPAHYKLMRDTVNAPTEAMEFGTAVHCGVLEADTFAGRVVCGQKFDRRTKEGKAGHAAFAAEHAGKLILDPDAHARSLRCIQAVRKHPAASRLLDGAQTELSLLWIDGRYKVPCKARFDAWNRGIVVDLKTTQDASPEAFARSIASFMYHMQAAVYIDAAEHVLDESPSAFVFVAVEAEPPHAVACYALPSEAVLAGKRLQAIALERYAAALASGAWAGYPETIDMIQLPRYALKFN